MSNLEKLRELTEKMSQIEEDMEFFFENIPVLFVIGDRKGSLMKINSEWTKYLGWSKEELTSQSWLNFVHPDDIEKTIKASSILETENLNGFENRYRTKSGEYKTLKWFISSWINGKNYGVALQLD